MGLRFDPPNDLGGRLFSALCIDLRRVDLPGLTPTVERIVIALEQQLDERTHASAPSLCLSTTFSVQEPLSFSANALAESDPWCYTRWANPTVRQLEHKLAALEGVAYQGDEVLTAMAADATRMSVAMRILPN